MSNKEKQTPLTAPELTEEAITILEKEQTSYTLWELLQMEIEDLPCLFSPIFLKSGIAVLVGGSDSGKSSLLRQMAMCVATGRDFLGWKYQGVHHAAAYFSSEDDKTLTARVVRSYNKTMNLGEMAAQNLLFEFDFTPDNIIEKVKAVLDERPRDLIVIDAFGDAFWGKSLNDNKEVREFYSQFKALAKQYDCLIVFNHHTGKRTVSYAPDKDNSLGSQAIEAAPRIAIELRQDPTDPDTKHFCIVKANYLGSDFKTKSFAIRMDANYVFATTGERVEFSSLVKTTKPERKSKRPEDVSTTDHRDFIRGAFLPGEINQTRLRQSIVDEFDISGRTADKYIQFYLQKHWIEEAGKGKCNAVLYKSLVI